jgi:hypothetical protein
MKSKSNCILFLDTSKVLFTTPDLLYALLLRFFELSTNHIQVEETTVLTHPTVRKQLLKVNFRKTVNHL